MPAFRATTTCLALAASLVAAAPLVHPASAGAEPAPRGMSTTVRQRALAATVALTRAGFPYRWGAAGPRAFDCSGLVAYAYERAGRPLRARTSYEMHRRGVRIRRSSLRRGDLVYTWDRGYGHVGIYVGRGRYVHAPGSGRDVQVAPLPGAGGHVGAVRP